MGELPTHVERIDPILCVEDLDRALRFYTQVLGFAAVEWRTQAFSAVSIDGLMIYLAERMQGRPGGWVWIAVGDVRALHALYASRGATIREAPTRYPWALEMQIEDPDGNVLRFASDPE